MNILIHGLYSLKVQPVLFPLEKKKFISCRSPVTAIYFQINFLDAFL